MKKQIFFTCLIGVFCLACDFLAVPPSYIENPTPQALSTLKNARLSASAEPAPTENALVTVTAVEALNLRASAGIHAHILEVLPTGTELYVLGNCTYDNGYWVNVVTEDREAGWVNTQYISGEVCP
jgi:uncharacterized protein YgiM (DUF1202 family)